MSEEKESIGQDVLGGGGWVTSRMSEKKRKELEKKLKEELAKKKAEEEKLPKLPIPGEKPPEMSEEEWQELQMRARLTGQLLEDEEKDVHVNEHYRSKPKSKKKEKQFEEIF